MPGIREILIPEMRQESVSAAGQSFQEWERKDDGADVGQKLSKRARIITEPLTPENEPSKKGACIAAAVRGSLIHITKSADGKLRWLPPSSSTSSSQNEGKVFSRCISGDAADGPAVTISPIICEVGVRTSDSAGMKVSSKGNKRYEEPESSEVGPASPSLTSCCRDRGGPDSATVHSVETTDDSDVQEASFGPEQQLSSASELSSSQQPIAANVSKNMLATGRGHLPFPTHGLSPYLSSKLKPGKHILGVKKHQVYIRPGQLRHWAVGNSPALASNLANLPAAALKGKACRTLTF